MVAEEEHDDEAEEVVKPALGEVQHVPFHWPVLSDQELIERSSQFYEVIQQFIFISVNVQ